MLSLYPNAFFLNLLFFVYLFIYLFVLLFQLDAYKHLWFSLSQYNLSIIIIIIIKRADECISLCIQFVEYKISP